MSATMTEELSPAEKVLSKPNTLIVYKGGGYDGCFWENNIALIDADGEFVDIYSSGYYGCPTREKLAEKIHRIEVLGDTHQWYHTTDLNDPEACNEFADAESLNTVIGIAKVCKERGINAQFFPQCGCCEQRFDPTADDLEFDYTGNNGIGIEVTDVYCPECVRKLTCPCCHYVMEQGHQFHPENGYCQDCIQEHGCE